MIQITTTMKQLIQKHSNKDIRLIIIAGLFDDTPEEKDDTPEEKSDVHFNKIKIGDLLNIIPNINSIFTAETTINEFIKNTDNIGQPLKSYLMIVYTFDSKNSNITGKIIETPSNKDFKELQNLEQTDNVICTVLRVEFGDDTIGWTIIGPVEPKNIIHMEKMLLENEIGYKLDE